MSRGRIGWRDDYDWDLGLDFDNLGAESRLDLLTAALTLLLPPDLGLRRGSWAVVGEEVGGR